MMWLLGRIVRLVLLLTLVLLLAVVGLVVLFRYADPPTSTLMAWQWMNGVTIDRRPMPLEAISPELAHAVLTSEDNHFCTHGGVDWQAVGEVLESLEDGGEPRGASTITMQVAKNLFLWPSRSYVRKGLEVPLAYLIDFTWPKRRVIEVYLNIAEWGPGVFGAEAAAQAHFAKPASALTRSEASLLAAALPAPHARTAGKPGPQTRRIAERIRRRMAQTDGLFDCVAESQARASAAPHAQPRSAAGSPPIRAGQASPSPV